MDGILNINKPAGITSFSAVSRVKKLCGEKHAGHAGTLDPIAAGVLPVCLGKATRVVEFLQSAAKSYRAGIRLGVTTDTCDADGTVTHQCDPSAVSRLQIETVLNGFHGEISQTPPVYSAIKQNGQPLYRLARAGLDVQPKARPVTIYRIALLEFASPLLTLEVDCSKGTYIRSLARDIGEGLGCGATMQSLVRLGYGPFKLTDAITLDELARLAMDDQWTKYLCPVDFVLQDWPAVTVDSAAARNIADGKPLADSAGLHGERGRVYLKDGAFLGIVKYSADTGQWKPDKIFIGSAEIMARTPPSGSDILQ